MSIQETDKVWLLKEFKNLRIEMKANSQLFDRKLEKLSDKQAFPKGFWLNAISLFFVLGAAASAVTIFAIEGAVLPIELKSEHLYDKLTTLDTTLQREMNFLHREALNQATLKSAELGTRLDAIERELFPHHKDKK